MQSIHDYTISFHLRNNHSFQLSFKSNNPFYQQSKIKKFLKIEKSNYYCMKDGKSYCAKVMDISDPEMRKIVRNEIMALKRVNGHKNIINFIESFEMETEEGKKTSIEIFELSQINLAKFIELKGGKLKESTAKKICKQIVTAMNHIHSKLVIHNDIKLENIMIDLKTHKIKIIDFLSSDVLDHPNQLSSTSNGSLLYFAPEKCLKNNERSGYLSDVWSFGVLLYRMVVGRFPFNQLTALGLIASILKDDLKFPSFCSPNFVSLIDSILQKNPEKRIDLISVSNHAWFSCK